jgi:hypothetical protein
VLCWLLYAPILLIATVAKVLFGFPLILANTNEQTIIRSLGTLVVLLVAVQLLFVRNGRWQAIVDECSKLTAEQKRVADRRFLGFVAASLMSLAMAAAIGVMAGILRH